MAKSKKALKALKRRKEAQKRSRVVKERQDYRAGGRVKAFAGAGINIPQDQIDKAVKAYADSQKQLGSEQPPTGDTNNQSAIEDSNTPVNDPTPGDTTPPVEDITPSVEETTPTGPTQEELDAQALAERRDELRRKGTISMDTDGDGYLSPEELAAAVIGPTSSTSTPTSDSTTTDLGTTDSTTTDTGTPTTTTTDTGTPTTTTTTTTTPTRPEATAESPFNFDMNVPAGTEIRNIRVNDGTGGRSVRVPVPWGALQEEERQSLINIYNRFPGPEEEILRARAAYDFLQNKYGLLSDKPPEEEKEEDPETTRPATTIGFDGFEYTDSAAAQEANARLLEQSPFDYSNVDIPLNSRFGSEVKYIRINDGTGNRKVVVPWFRLSEAQQQGLINIYNNYPYPNQETDRAIDAYKYLNEIFGLKSEPEEDEVEEEAEDYLDEDAPPINPIVGDPVEGNLGLSSQAVAALVYSFSFSSYEDLSPRPLRKDYTDKRGKAGFDSYKEALNRWNQGRNWWNSKSAEERRDYFQAIPAQQLAGGVSLTGEGGTLVFPLAAGRSQTETGGIRGQSGDPAQSVLDKVYDEETREKFKVDSPEAFTVKTTPQLGTDLTGRVIDEIEGVGQQDIATTDITVTPGTFKPAVAQAAITAETMKAYDQAQANYFLKYPDAKRAVESGAYPDFLSYHEAEGKNKEYVLGFDPTRIAGINFQKEAKATAATEIDTTAARRDEEAERQALADETVEFGEDPRSQVEPIIGTGGTFVSPDDAEAQRREALLEETPASGTEAVIQGTVGYEASQRREVKGQAAKGEAVSFLEELLGTGVDPIPEGISEAILDDPATVTAQVDNQPADVQAAIAALPNEALVSVQLENLLAGIDEGQTPPWARPAVQLVESRLAARGLSVSTVGRDALFNAIIQTAIPIAQSNATALQQRATQNLSNQQQANLQQATQSMQLRLTNLANRQEAASQSAQLAQQINLTQGQFAQQARMSESEQLQQVRIASLQNEQQAAMSNLGNDQQIELANLQVEAERLGANQSAENQERLAEMQVAANFMQKNEEFVQQMELANISNEQQMRLAFLTAKNQAASETLTMAQQTELANLNKNLEANKISANLAQQLGLAQLNVDQQLAIRNATTVANMDMAKFSTEQQIELANSKFMQTATLQDLNNRQQVIMQDATALASMNLQEADSTTKVSIENARNFLQKDLAQLNVTQQAYLLDSQQRQQRLLTTTAAETAASQFNATSTNQTNQFMANLGQQLNMQNAAQENAMSQFNASEANRIAAIEAGNDLEAAKLEAQVNAQIDQFNTQIEFQRDQWNEQNSQAVEQSNVNWRRQVNMAETAAQNAANQLQAQQLFQLSQQEQAFLWQQLRDEATYYRQQYESEQQRKTTLYATALANEAEHSVHNVQSTFTKIAGLFSQLGGMGTSEAQRGRG
tara:strand:+ start:92 stop:4390 length:4299 start_codon:yes stop_codon:yes gene_type:complete